MIPFFLQHVSDGITQCERCYWLTKISYTSGLCHLTFNSVYLFTFPLTCFISLLPYYSSMYNLFGTLEKGTV